jgi:hypothetical protein
MGLFSMFLLKVSHGTREMGARLAAFSGVASLVGEGVRW